MTEHEDHLEGTISWRELAAGAVARLSAAGVEAADLEARWLAEEASGIEPGDWFLENSELARRRGVASFDAMLDRRLRGEPIQYVLGHWAFRRLDLAIDRRVLIPRPETEVIVDLALREIATRSLERPMVADLGTGSGAIGLSIAAEHPLAEVIATDVSPDAIAVARANIAGLGRAGARVRLHEGSWFDALPEATRGGFDVVLSNPPYIARDEVLPASVVDWEPTGALVAGSRGIECVEHLLVEARRWLAPGGLMILEMASDQTPSAAELASLAGYSRVAIEPDLTGRPRFVLVSAS